MTAPYSIIVCSSTNHMLRADELLVANHVPRQLIPVPGYLGSVCNTAIKVRTADLSRVKELLGGVQLEGIYPLEPQKLEGVGSLLTGILPKEFQSVIGKLAQGEDFTRDELIYLLSLQELPLVEKLYTLADRMRRQVVGDVVDIRAAIEFSNYCRQNCCYCGLRRDNSQLLRYRMEPGEIVGLSKNLFRMGIRTVILQSGEDSCYTVEMLVALVKAIKKAAKLGITLSIGERAAEEYRLLREAGANNFLLKIETANPELYAVMHPGADYIARVHSTENLRDLGYRTGSGNIIGLPGQSIEDLADDILFMKEKGIHMVGIGPFLPAANTPLAGNQPGSEELTLKTIAVARLVLKNVFIPSTTALATLNPDAQAKGLQVGANTLMIIATPERYRANYEIYSNKAAVNLERAIELVTSLGRELPRPIRVSMGLRKTK